MTRRLFGARSSSADEKAARVPDGVRAYVIGDIHGCSDLLDQLHAWIAQDWSSSKTREGVVIYTGDYVDRGPDSAGVLERLVAGAPHGITQRFLRGNHEDVLQQFLVDPSVWSAWGKFGGLQTLLSYRVEFKPSTTDEEFGNLSKRFSEALPGPHRAFLENLETSISLGDYFFCHAGVRPGVPLEAQQVSDLLWIRSEFLNSTADFGKIVVHGHTPVESPDFQPNRINIDTGAFATGHLSCLVLEGAERKILWT